MKFLVTLLIALVTFATADAAKVDIYKAAFQNKTFTLKYKVNEFPIRSVNKKATTAQNGSGSQTISSAVGMGAVNSGGVIVMNNKDSYFENSYDAFTWIFKNKDIKIKNFESKGSEIRHDIKAGGSATLFKDSETFKFVFEINDDGTKNYFNRDMWGGKNIKVKAQSEKDAEKIEKYSDPYQKLFQDYNFGNQDLYQALAPILPPEQVIVTPNTPIYKFAGAGNLSSGLTYEDFYGEKNNTHYAIRYYFSGDKMTKIATFTYLKDESVVQYYEKHVIDIEEFLTTADENYLKLPEGLQDTTKRDKDGGKK